MRFHFNVRAQDMIHHDREGGEYANEAAAISAARCAAKAILKDAFDVFGDRTLWRIDVVDDQGNKVADMTLIEAASVH